MSGTVTKRNLSGIYFRSECTGKWEPVCFEDLPEDEQLDAMQNRDEEWFKSLAMQLAKTLREVGDEFDIAKE